MTVYREEKSVYGSRSCKARQGRGKKRGKKGQNNDDDNNNAEMRAMS